MIQKFSKEIQDYIKTKNLQVDDKITVLNRENKQQATFKGFPKMYRGRLLTDPSAHGAEPGIYLDRSKVLLEIDGKTSEVGIDNIEISSVVYDDADHFINMALDKLSDLPETTYLEGDIVSLIDKNHLGFPADPDDNQFTIYRVYYKTAEDSKEATKYRLRAGNDQFDANEDQLQTIASGPVRLFYSSGDGSYRLLWKSTKEEAEFHLLLGRFDKVYNPISNSYVWSLDPARQVITLGKAHGILQDQDTYYMIKLWDDEIGRELSTSNIILSI